MKHKFVVLAGIAAILAGALYLSHSLLLRYVVERHLRSQLGKTTNIELAGAEVTRTGLLLRQVSIERPGVNIQVPLLTIDMDPWKYLFGRRVLDRVEVDSARVRLSINAMKKGTKRPGAHHRPLPVFNLLVLKNFSISLQDKGRQVGSVKGSVHIDTGNGHGPTRSYDILGNLAVSATHRTYHGTLKGRYSFSGMSDMVLDFDAPVRFPTRAGTAIVKEIRLHDQRLSFPSCGLERLGMNVKIRGLSIKIANAGILSGLARPGALHRIKEILANHVVLRLLPVARPGKIDEAATELTPKQAALAGIANLNQKLNRLGFLEDRLSERDIPKISILGLDIIKDKQPLISGIKLNFSHRKQGGWTLTATGAGLDISVRTLKDQDWQASEISWHLPGCKVLGMLLPGLVTASDDCVSDLNISIKQHSSNGWSMNIAAGAGPLTVNHPFLCEEPVGFNSLKLNGFLSYDATKKVLNFANGRLIVNGLKVDISLLVSLAQHPAINLTMDLPRTKAMDLLRNLPAALTTRISGMKFAGTFAFKGMLHLDLDDLAKSSLSLHPDCSNLKLVSVPRKMDVATLSGNFIQTIQTDDEEIKRNIGPDSPDWVPLDDIPPYFIDCLLASEDVTFFKHHGFYTPAIRDALVADLTRHSIVRGASTISQQLAKNLFLSKSKSIARKLQEVVLTWYLESTLSKQRILELYLNIIEWGPHIYGISQASMHYFGIAPSDLDLAEAAFLVTIIPSPIPWHQKCVALHRIPKAIKSKITRLLRILLARKVIDEDVIKEAMEEPIDFNTETIGSATH